MPKDELRDTPVNQIYGMRPKPIDEPEEKPLYLIVDSIEVSGVVKFRYFPKDLVRIEKDWPKIFDLEVRANLTEPEQEESRKYFNEFLQVTFTKNSEEEDQKTFDF